MTDRIEKWTLLDSTAGVTFADGSRIETSPFFRCENRRLTGGLREGVDVAELSNNALCITIVPSRGMGIADVRCGDLRLGWNSPVHGPVNPQFVRLMEPGGLGWLDGFDEWLVRCGLESNGAPEHDELGRLLYPLHGRIANRPAHKVELTFDHESSEIALTGVVDETRFHFQKLRLTSTIRLRPDATTFQIHDQIENLSGRPATAQLLYHINFGPPLLGPGAELIVPAKRLAPLNAHAAADIGGWSRYGEPDPSFEEQCYLMTLQADKHQRTLVLLKSADGQFGAGLRFNVEQLPYFTQWKNTTSYEDGYVTGLEPATNFPNQHSYEQQHGRIMSLAPGETRDFVIDVTIATTASGVQQLADEVQGLQADQPAEIHTSPIPDWCAA